VALTCQRFPRLVAGEREIRFERLLKVRTCIYVYLLRRIEINGCSSALLVVVERNGHE